MVEIKDRSKLLKSLKSRIYSYKNRDKRHGIENTDITVDICMELIEKSDGICISCNCEMLFENVTRYCVYQFTIDAIDPPKGHTKGNIRLLCFTCNSRSGLVFGMGGPSGKLGFKKEWPCIGGCHLINGFTREQMENWEHLPPMSDEEEDDADEDIHNTVTENILHSIPIYADKKLGTVEWEKICCLRNKLRKTIDEKEILSIREEIHILEERLNK
jgi:hypothetical protein